MGRVQHQRFVNLTFHGIGEPERPIDPPEAAVWVTRRQFLSVLDAVAGRPDVRISFDDGNTSDVLLAAPALAQRGMTATFFVLAGRLGAPGFLDAQGVRELATAGMAVGCHGLLHRPWRELADAELRTELVDARAILEDVVQTDVVEASCPFGSYDRRVLRELRRASYDRVYTSDRGLARTDEWLQARNTVREDGGSDVVGPIEAAAGSRPQALRRSAKLAVKRWR